MTKTPRQSKSGIEYVLNKDGTTGYSWGVFSGCWNWKERNGYPLLSSPICPVPNCWARNQTQRFKKIYPYGFEPHIYPEALLSPLHIKKPSTFAVGWTGDLVGYADPNMVIPVDYLAAKVGVATACFQDALFGIIRQCPQHRFLFLTKNPERLPLWSPFPSNCEVGFSACNQEQFDKGITYLKQTVAKVKFISFEPLLGGIFLSRKPMEISFIVIGAQTRPTVLPRIEWVRDIVEACDRIGIPVWLKNNLSQHWGGNLPEESLFYSHDENGLYLRHELPKGEA